MKDPLPEATAGPPDIRRARGAFEVLCVERIFAKPFGADIEMTLDGVPYLFGKSSKLEFGLASDVGTPELILRRRSGLEPGVNTFDAIPGDGTAPPLGSVAVKHREGAGLFVVRFRDRFEAPLADVLSPGGGLRAILQRAEVLMPRTFPYVEGETEVGTVTRHWSRRRLILELRQVSRRVPAVAVPHLAAGLATMLFPTLRRPKFRR